MLSKENEESSKGVAEKKGAIRKDVVLEIADTGTEGAPCNLELAEHQSVSLRRRAQASKSTGSASPEIATSSSKPPNVPTQRNSLLRTDFSKPKSRLVEPHNPNDPKLAAERKNSVDVISPSNRVKSAAITQKTPLVESPQAEDEEEVYRTASLKVREKIGKKMKVLVIIEWILFVSIMGLLISILTVTKLQKCLIWGLELWKWCVLVLVIFCGRLFTQWFMNVLIFLIERNFLLKKKVLYFVHGLKKSVRFFVWLCLVLLAWCLLFDSGVKRSAETTKTQNYITRALASFLIGAAIWLIKTFLVKLLASSFQCSRFFDRIQESIYHQYILRTLSGPPLIEMGENVGRSNTGCQLSFTRLKGNEGKKEEVIDVEKLKKIKQGKISAWAMRGLVNVISGSGLSTISNTLESYDDEEWEQKDEEITSEWEAKAAAYQIFKNMAKPGCKYIEEEDLFRYMKKEEVENMLPLFEGAAETRKIKRSMFKKWVVNVYLERKSLVHSLNDTKTAIEELNKLVSGIVIVVTIIVWLLLMGFLTTEILVFISSQLLLVAFMFGNTVKTVFEAIIFVFVIHPFDVGDRCVIDGVQMIVEEMNILTTVFLRYDNEKIFYPNSVLAMKPISNFYRSPEMSDSVDFSIDVSTSIESIGVLKSRIKVYLESNPQHWRPVYSLVVKEIVDVNKMKMALYITHTINFQNYAVKNNRRSELVLELKKIFEDLAIKYHLLPQEVHLSCVGSADSVVPLPLR